MNWLVKFLWPEGKIHRVVAVSLLINHVIGLIGLNTTGLRPAFEAVSWLNLLLSAFLILGLGVKWQAYSVAGALWVFAIGLIIEIAGVNTGLIFGPYSYTNALGYKVANTPILIGLNWLLLLFSCAAVANYFKRQPWVTLCLAATLMVIIDLPLEKFAVKHQLWLWLTVDKLPHLQNFVAWWLTSLFMLLSISVLNFQNWAFGTLLRLYFVLLMAFLIVDYIIL